VSIVDLYVKPTLAGIKASVVDIAQGAGLLVTSWIFGEPSERWIEISARAIDLFTSTIVTQYARGFFLDLATDPGDPGDLSADQTPRPGWLSALGLAWYGTERRGQTFASGSVSLTNSSGAAKTFFPGDFTFQNDTAASDGGFATYVNAPDPSVYVNVDGSVTMADGATLTIPVTAEIIGSYSNASPGQISIVVTGTFGTFTVTNGAPVTGEEREAPEAYRERCRTAADSQSPGGPGAAYRRAANTAIDGSPLQLYTGAGAVGITRTQVIAPDGLGTVNCYFADRDGPCTTDDLDSANANIIGVAKGVITDPIGVVPDGVSYTGLQAASLSVSVAGSVRIKAGPGVTSAGVKQAIVDALGANFETIPIGGLDQDSGGFGTIYTSDFVGVVRDAFPGIYDPIVTTPATSSTAVDAGYVPVLSTSTGDWTVTIV